LGECDLPDDDQQSLIEKLLDVYRNDPDAGLHAAAEWLLRQWKQGDQLAAIDAALQQSEAELRSAENQTRQWFINGQGQTYVILDADTFQMGSPESEPDHNTDEIPHTRRINRRFAISSKEVTKAQWRKFSTNFPPLQQEFSPLRSVTSEQLREGRAWLRSGRARPIVKMGSSAKDPKLQLGNLKLTTSEDFKQVRDRIMLFVFSNAPQLDRDAIKRVNAA
ncbi:MAG: SUMF1/EgtB/PvdO family nonheme iron enzyme, partial [Fuerstiella sp.]|nr:SUMF1/EgtB/PvdO family nonheme iron enzyme [Fuerstiella sp.]